MRSSQPEGSTQPDIDLDGVRVRREQRMRLGGAAPGQTAQMSLIARDRRFSPSSEAYGAGLDGCDLTRPPRESRRRCRGSALHLTVRSGPAAPASLASAVRQVQRREARGRLRADRGGAKLRSNCEIWKLSSIGAPCPRSTVASACVAAPRADLETGRALSGAPGLRSAVQRAAVRSWD